MKQWELEEVIALMKRERLLKVKLGGLEVEMAPAAFASADASDTAKKDEKPAPKPEDFLFWSVPDSEREEPNAAKGDA